MENIVKIGLLKYLINDNKGFASCVDPADRRLRYKKLEIPENIVHEGKTYLVKEIHYNSFCSSRIEEIVLPPTIETINYSFSRCQNLRKINIPKSVKCISPGSFYNCPELVDIYFEGNPDDIIIGISAFTHSGWLNKRLKKLNEDEFCSPSVEEQVIYLGKSLVGVWRGIKELRVKPGTRNVYLYNCSDLEKIFFPSSIDTLEINAITNLKEVHYETMESFLGLHQIDSFRQRENFDLYIGGEKIIDLEIPVGTKILRKYLTDKTTVKNIDLPGGLNYIYDFAISENIDEIYFPKNIDFVATRNIARKVILWSSLARRVLNGHSSLKELVILIEPLSPADNKKYFNYSFGFPYECKTAALIFTFDPTPSEVTQFFKDIWMHLISHYTSWTKLYLSPEALLCEDFFQSSVLSSVKHKGKCIYVPPYLVEKFKNHIIWGQFTVMPGEYSSLKYEVLDDSTACVVCNPDSEGNNTYSGLYRIPDYVEINEVLHKVSKVSNFAFSSISDRLRVIVPWDIIVDGMAFFDSPKAEIIDYVIEGYEEGKDSNE